MRFLVTALIFIAMVQPSDAAPLLPLIAAAGAFLASGTVVANLTIAAIFTGVQFAVSTFLAPSSLSARGKKAAEVNKPGVSLPEYNSVGIGRDIYGTYVVSGLVFFQDTVADTGASGTDIFVQGMVLSNGECDSIISVIINGVECSLDTSGFASTAPWAVPGSTYLKVSFRSGTTTQIIDPIILARFPNLEQEIKDELDDQALIFAQRGWATAVLELKYGTDANHHVELWGQGAIPDIKIKLRGRKIFNPANPASVHGDTSTYEYSNNATAVILDKLLADAKDIKLADINLDAFRDQILIDDLSVPTLGGGFEKRNTIDGPVLSNEGYVDVLNDMIYVTGAQLSKSLETYFIRGAADEKPVGTIAQQHVIDNLSYTNHSDNRSLLNTSKIIFEPDSKFNADGEIDFSIPALVTQDGGKLDGDGPINLRFVTRSAHAQRRAWEIIQETRFGATVSGEFDIAVFVVSDENGYRLLIPGDILTADLTDWPQLNGNYVVDDFEITKEFSVIIKMTLTDYEIYKGFSTTDEIEFKKDIA